MRSKLLPHLGHFDGIGDLVSIETETDAPRATRLAYNVLQGAGARISMLVDCRGRGWDAGRFGNGVGIVLGRPYVGELAPPWVLRCCCRTRAMT